MNCDDCRELISILLDNELPDAQASAVRDHLSLCGECAVVCADLSSILSVVSDDVVTEVAPPNSQALWCRIHNTIESELKPVEPEPEKVQGRFWQLSFLQLAAAVLCVGLISSLLTIVAVRNYTAPSGDDLTTRSRSTQTTIEKVLSRVGLIETPQQAREARLQEQQAAIDYWNARVQMRRQQWNHTTREAFDRNLRVIEESVNDYTMILQHDPDDELSGEMLDAVMTDKMNLLRDFADL